VKRYGDITGDGGSRIADQVGEQTERLRARLSTVRHIVAVMSGKGGVGKSTLTLNLASACALDGLAVGILDADINGSSIPGMAGLRGRELTRGDTGLVPPAGALNLRVVSIDFLLRDDRAPVVWDAPTQRDAYTWRALMEMGAVRELLSDAEWGELDFLFLDLPPGTDRLPNLIGLLPRISGTVIVTIPSAVSRLIVGKSIRMANAVDAPVIGVVENMSAYVCAGCGREATLFPGEQTESWAREEGVSLLGRVPFDPRIPACADEGILFMTRHADTPAGDALRRVAHSVREFAGARAAGGAATRRVAGHAGTSAGPGGRA
jgi:ATP-binding protein involved in chromosome partitioning